MFLQVLIIQMVFFISLNIVFFISNDKSNALQVKKQFHDNKYSMRIFVNIMQVKTCFVYSTFSS